ASTLLRYWAAAQWDAGTMLIIVSGLLHHQQRQNALQRQQLDAARLPTLQIELDALRTTQTQLQSELDDLVSQLTTFNQAQAQLDERLTRQQTQITALLNPPEDPRWHSLPLRIQQLQTRTTQPPKPVARL